MTQNLASFAFYLFSQTSILKSITIHSKYTTKETCAFMLRMFYVFIMLFLFLSAAEDELMLADYLDISITLD